MRMRIGSGSLAAIIVIVTAAPGRGGDEPGRYAMAPVGGGVVRMDTRSGTVSFCRPDDRNWRCEAVKDDGPALIAEQDRLRRENEALAAKAEKLNARLQETEAALRAIQARTKAGRSPAKPASETMREVIAVLDEMITRLRSAFESFSQKPPQRQL